MEKKLVMMLETKQGSEDGINVKTFEKETKCEIEVSLAKVFIKEGWAIGVSDPDFKDGENNQGEDKENKNQGGSSENKDQGKTDENKSGFTLVTDNPDAGKGEGIKLWTFEELDQLKMPALREIGEPLGARDTKKNELIKEILKAQENESKSFAVKMLDKLKGK